MNKKRIVLMCRDQFVEPFKQNNFEVFWTYPLVFPLFYEGKYEGRDEVLLEAEEFKKRLDSYKDKILEFNPTYFLADQWFFSYLFGYLRRLNSEQIIEERTKLWVDFVDELTKKGIITIVCCQDDPGAFARKKDVMPITHRFGIVVDPNMQMEGEYRKYGQIVIYFSDHVAIDYIKDGETNSLSHELVDNFNSNFHLFFVGNMGFDRQEFFYKLSKKVSGLDFFFGSKKFHYTSRKKIDFDVTNKIHLRKIYKDTLINVVFGSMCDLIYGFPKSWEVQTRIFDIAYCHGFFLCEYRKHLPDIFDIDPKLYSFKGLDECHKKIRFYLENSNSRKELADTFHKQVMERYTVDKAVKRLIGEIEQVTRKG